MRWQLLLEEFGPDIRHIQGEANVVADAISRLPIEEESNKYGYAKGDHELQAREQVQEDVLGYPLNVPLVRQLQQEELEQRNSKLAKLLADENPSTNSKISPMRN